MGCCAGSPERTQRNDNRSRQSGTDPGNGPAIGKNQPLQSTLPTWTSEAPLTVDQLQTKRNEFWETAPAYEGRKEIWEALKTACEAVLNNDFQLAQAIVNGVVISLPRGTLSEVYDELGNRYVIPDFCMCPPTNLVMKEMACEAAQDSVIDDEQPNVERVALKFRLSSCKDAKLNVPCTDSIAIVKYKLGKAEHFDGAKSRLFLSGKQLADKVIVGEMNIPKGFFIQVLVPS